MSFCFLPTLKHYLQNHPSLRYQYAQHRKAQKIPIKLPSVDIRLSPGKHNTLVKNILYEFGSRFIRDGRPLYIGDTAHKMAYIDKNALEKLGLSIRPHEKIPDIIIHDGKRNVIFLIEAMTSHGPINAKRKRELQRLFYNSKADLIYMTAFSDKRTIKQCVEEISWETEVWSADNPDHIIHFNGDKFLKSYDA